MLKKVISSLLLGAFLGSLLTSCGHDLNDNSGGKEVEKEATVLIWHSEPESTDLNSTHQRVLRTVKKYTDEYPNASIKVAGNAGDEKLLIAMSAGNGPDICKPDWIYGAQWGTTGVLADLTDYVNHDSTFDKDDIIPAAWDRCTYKGRIYTIPEQINSGELYYNIDLLKQGGYTDPPDTYDELVEMAVSLTQYDKNGNISCAGFIPDYPWLDNVLWPVAFGAKWIDPESNTITFDSPEMRASYQWQLDIYNQIGYDKLVAFINQFRTDLEGPFVKDQLAMQFCGEWMFNDIARYAPDMNYGVTSCPYPAENPELKESMFITANVWGMNNKTKNNKDDVWKLLSYLTSKETMCDVAQGLDGQGVLMARKSALNSLPETVHPLKNRVGQMLQSENCSGFPMSLYVNDYLAEITEQMTRVFTKRISLDDAMKVVTRKMQKFADENPINN